MGPTANVASIAALQDFQAALNLFIADARQALEAVMLEARRAGDWLQDQQRFWSSQVRPCEEEIVRCQSILSMRQTVFHGDRVPDCTEQEKDLEQARRQRDFVEEKLDRCRSWQTKLRRAIEEYEGTAQQLSGLIDGDLPKAVAWLNRLLSALDNYVALGGNAVVAPSAVGRAPESSSSAALETGRPPGAAVTVGREYPPSPFPGPTLRDRLTVTLAPIPPVDHVIRLEDIACT